MGIGSSCAALTLLSPGLALAGPPTEHRVLGWSSWFFKLRLAQRWSLYLDTQYRRIDFPPRWSQMLWRPGATFHVRDDVQLTIGSALLLSWPFDRAGPPSRELRPWQELGLADAIGRVVVEHRFRFEQRWRERLEAGEPSGRFGYNNRVRYRLQVEVPLNAPRKGPGVCSAVASEELLLEFGGGLTPGQVFDQNRIFVGVGFQATPLFSLQGGYMNLLSGIDDDTALGVQHIARVSLTFSFDAREPPTRGARPPRPRPPRAPAVDGPNE